MTTDAPLTSKTVADSRVSSKPVLEPRKFHCAWFLKEAGSEATYPVVVNVQSHRNDPVVPYVRIDRSPSVLDSLFNSC